MKYLKLINSPVMEIYEKKHALLLADCGGLEVRINGT
jgi:hypothetical protein